MPHRVAIRSRSHRHRIGGDITPGDLADLILWLDGSDQNTLYQDATLTTPVGAESDPVGGWLDKSGNGNHATQATTAKRPTYSADGLSFDGTDDTIIAAFPSLSQPITVFAVAQLDSSLLSSGDYYIIGGYDSSHRVILIKAATDNKFAIYGGTAIFGDPADDNFNVWNVLFNGTSSDFSIGGITQGSGDAGSNGMNGITVGARYGGSDKFWQGYISEILIYSRELTAIERTGIAEYLGQKWGII